MYVVREISIGWKISCHESILQKKKLSSWKCMSAGRSANLQMEKRPSCHENVSGMEDLPSWSRMENLASLKCYSSGNWSSGESLCCFSAYLLLPACVEKTFTPRLSLVWVLLPFCLSGSHKSSTEDLNFIMPSNPRYSAKVYHAPTWQHKRIWHCQTFSVLWFDWLLAQQRSLVHSQMLWRFRWWFCLSESIKTMCLKSVESFASLQWNPLLFFKIICWFAESLHTEVQLCSSSHG